MPRQAEPAGQRETRKVRFISGDEERTYGATHDDPNETYDNTRKIDTTPHQQRFTQQTAASSSASAPSRTSSLNPTRIFPIAEHHQEEGEEEEESTSSADTPLHTPPEREREHSVLEDLLEPPKSFGDVAAYQTDPGHGHGQMSLGQSILQGGPFAPGHYYSPATAESVRVVWRLGSFVVVVIVFVGVSQLF